MEIDYVTDVLLLIMISYLGIIYKSGRKREKLLERLLERSDR